MWDKPEQWWKPEPLELPEQRWGFEPANAGQGGPGEPSRLKNITVEDAIQQIDRGIFRGCVAPETAKAIVLAFEPAFNSGTKFGATSIAKQAGLSREHYYNFRNGCLKAGWGKINDKWDAVKAQSYAHFGREIIKVKGDSIQAGQQYPALPAGFIEGDFRIAGLEDERERGVQQ